MFLSQSESPSFLSAVTTFYWKSFNIETVLAYAKFSAKGQLLLLKVKNEHPRLLSMFITTQGKPILWAQSCQSC